MDYAQRHNILFSRERFSELVPVNAYEAGLFFCEGDRDYIGACFVGSPLIGADDSTVEMIRSGLSGDCPDDTILQVSYLSSSYIDNLVKVYAGSRRSRSTLSGRRFRGGGSSCWRGRARRT